MKTLLVCLMVFFAQSAMAIGSDSATVRDTAKNAETQSVVVGENSKWSVDERSWRRHKVYKRWAWTTATVGGAAALTGIVGKIIDKSTNDNYSDESSRHWNIPIFSGLAIAATSIPLFYYSKKELQHAQEPDYEKTAFYRYQKTHKVMKACAWTSLGVGVAADIATVMVAFISLGDETGGGSNDTACRILGISGAVLTFGSVPLFILSYKYKYKAKASMLDMAVNVTSVDERSCFGKTQSQPAISISIGF